MSKKTLSLDLRERVVAAVSGGMSRRQAAERFRGHHDSDGVNGRMRPAVRPPTSAAGIAGRRGLMRTRA